MPEYKYPGYGPTRENWLTYRPKTIGGYHGGNDNPAPAGTPVYAQYDGEVFRSGNINGYGLAVVVRTRVTERYSTRSMDIWLRRICRLRIRQSSRVSPYRAPLSEPRKMCRGWAD
jgi:hypothetical protein